MRGMNRPFRAAAATLLVILASLSPVVALAQQPSDLGPLTAAPWLLVELGGVAMPADAGITATFAEDGSLSGSAGCNDYNATYSVNGGSMTVGALAATLKGCGGAVNARETDYLSALQAVATWVVSDGRLTLTSADGTTLVYAGPQGIEGAWTLLTIGTAPLPSTIRATAVFAADGTLTGNGGCNDYNGTYTVGGDSLTVSALSTTRKACDLATSGIERLFLDGLQSATSFLVAGSQLTIRGVDGSILVLWSSAAGPSPSAAPLPTIEPLPSGGPVPSALPPSAGSIVGTWQMVQFGGTALPAGILNVTVTFGSDGTVTGNGGCNDFSGTYTLNGTKLALAVLPTTQKTCDTTTAAMEQGLMQILPYVDSATLANGQLTLGSSVVGFEVVFAPAS